jgi:hypothetical protein
MRRCFVAFAFALALGGCDSPPHPVAAPEEPGISGPIDGKRAVEFLYGPFDAKLDAAVWTVKNLAPGSVGDDVLTEDEEALVSVVLAKAAKEGDQERFYLGVSMVPKTAEGDEAFDCEACAPIVGATVFVKRGERWVVEAHEPFIETLGQNGHGPGMELVAIGPTRNGILVKADWFNRGNTGSFARLWTQEGQKIADRLSVQLGEENGGNCSDEPKAQLDPCYDHKLDLSFQPGPQVDRYDILTKPSDPEWTYDDAGHKGEQLFRFDGAKYSAVLSGGSVQKATAATITPPWSGPVPDNDPAALLGAFMRADAQGLQVSSGNWPLVTAFATWEDGPGWDTSTIVEWAEVAEHHDLGKRSDITVRMRKIGDLHSDGDGMPVLDTSTAGMETRKFILQNVGKGGETHWKIVEPQDGPHLAVDYALMKILPDWCGKRDCTKTTAYRVLRERQQACPSSPIRLNRTCNTVNK